MVDLNVRRMKLGFWRWNINMRYFETLLSTIYYKFILITYKTKYFEIPSAAKYPSSPDVAIFFLQKYLHYLDLCYVYPVYQNKFLKIIMFNIWTPFIISKRFVREVMYKECWLYYFLVKILIYQIRIWSLI